MRRLTHRYGYRYRDGTNISSQVDCAADRNADVGGVTGTHLDIAT